MDEILIFVASGIILITIGYGIMNIKIEINEAKKEIIAKQNAIAQMLIELKNR